MLRAYIIPAIFVSLLVAVAAFRPEFVDVPSLLLTVGGALVITLCSYSRAQTRELRDAIRALFKERQHTAKEHVEELTRLTRLFRLEGLKALETQERSIEDAYARKAVGLLIDLEKEEKIRSILENELAEAVSRDEMSRQILSTMGKLLPSFGLIGTLIGMVLLLRNIAGQDLATLPAAMSLAVLTTLYGAVFANLVVAPLAARLHALAMERELQMRLTADWTLMLVRGENAATISEQLNGRLPAAQSKAQIERRWSGAVFSVQR